MNCQKCNIETKVIDSRSTKAGDKIRRRRQCPQCKTRFSTYEHRNATDLEQKLTIAQCYINSLVTEIETVKYKMMKIESQKPKKKVESWKV